MKFNIDRDALLPALQQVVGAVAKNPQAPILSHVLLKASDQELSLLGSDLELELYARVYLTSPCEQPGTTSVCARKLLDITRALPDGSLIQFHLKANQLTVTSGRSRFLLSILSGDDFPRINQTKPFAECVINENQLRPLLERVAFSMAAQDVRFFLNGLLLKNKGNTLLGVAADGHRMAVDSLEVNGIESQTIKTILPRRTVLELLRLFKEGNQQVTVVFGEKHIEMHTDAFTINSKIIQAEFPDYERILNKVGDKTLQCDAVELKQVLSRIAILSHERNRVVRLTMENNKLLVSAINAEKEQAEEEIDVQYTGPALEIAFNVNYLLEALGIFPKNAVVMQLNDQTSSTLLKSNDSGFSAKYVIMPLKL